MVAPAGLGSCRVREFLQHVLPSLFLLELVHSRGDEGDKTASPHARPTGEDVGREGGTGVVNKLPRRVETFAAMAEKAGSICLGVEIEEEGAIHNGKTAMEDIKTVLELSCKRENRTVMTYQAV